MNMNNHQDKKKWLLLSRNKNRSNGDTEDLKELNAKNSPESEILNINKENIKEGPHDIFRLSKTEEKPRNYLINHNMQQIQEPNGNISLLDQDASEEKWKNIMMQEINQIETITKDKKRMVAELGEEIKTRSNRNIDRVIEACSERTSTIYNQIFTMSTEISQLNSQINDLEMKIRATVPTVNAEDVWALNLRNSNHHSNREAKLMQMLSDYEEFIRDHEELKKKSEKRISDNTASLKEHIKEVDAAIKKLAYAEENTYSILQNALTNHGILSSKLKMTDKVRENLKKETEYFPIESFHQKRRIEEANDLKESIKNKMAVEGKKARKK